MHLPQTLFGSAILLSGLASAANGSNSHSPGCDKPLPKTQEPGKSHNVTDFTTEDGRKRSYIVHIPSNYDKSKAVPLIFSFHGRHKTAGGQEALSQFSNEDWNPNAIAVYPQGIDNEWQGDPDSHGINDISFTMQMLTHFENTYCLDTTRIYASGKSNGGGLTDNLACDPTASKRIAAFAPVSGAYYQDDVSSEKCNATAVDIQCNPGRAKIPILEFHGTADKTIPYAGGGRRKECLPSVPHMVREWAGRDGLETKKNETTQLFDGKVQRYRFGKGEEELGLVTHYRVEGLGHAWPSKEANGDNPDGTYLDATPIIMDFFKRWTL